MGTGEGRKAPRWVVAAGLAFAGSASFLGADEPAGLSVRMEADTGAVLAEFARGGSLVTARSRPSTGGRIELRVEVNAVEVDAEFDPGKRVLHLDGHDRALFEEEKLALQAMSLELEKRWEPFRRPVSDSQHFLFRLILLLSEAPAGWTLEARDIEVPAPEGVKLGLRQAPRDPTLLLEPREGMSRQPPPSLHQREATEGGGAQCEVADNNGVTYMACFGHSEPLFHDASPIHCWGYLWEWSGCDLVAGCLGRCGGRCGNSGAGAYTWDCGDHDSCCRWHGGCFNPFDTYCGDEYSDAVGDFFSGANCAGCGFDPFSCYGNCGFQAPGGCWCDFWCEQYGDCCYDYYSWC